MVYYREKSSTVKKARNRLMLAFLALTLVTAVLGTLYTRANASTTRMQDVLIRQVNQEIAQANTYAQQLTSSGGSNTSVHVGRLRQHLYALSQLDSLSSSVYGVGHTLIDVAKISQAMEYLDECETRLLAGQSIASQLVSVRSLLEDLSQQIRQRRI